MIPIYFTQSNLSLKFGFFLIFFKYTQYCYIKKELFSLEVTKLVNQHFNLAEVGRDKGTPTRKAILAVAVFNNPPVEAQGRMKAEEEGGLKLFTNKPKKGNKLSLLEIFSFLSNHFGSFKLSIYYLFVAKTTTTIAQLKAKDLSSPTTATGTSSSSSSAAAAASYKMGSQSTAPPPPPQPPKESFARRYKFLWPLILTVNLSVGGARFLCLFNSIV
jgi:hypothetical protein